MRRFFLFIATLFALCTYSQKIGTCVFDFTKPISLTPSITPAEIYNEVDVTDSVFVNGPIKIYFENTNTLPLGVRLHTGSNEVFLSVKALVRFVFQANAGTSIESIEFSDDGYIGNLHIDSKQPEGMDEESYNRRWYNKTSNDVSSVAFFQGSTTPAEIKRVSVTYKQSSTTKSYLLATPSILNYSELSSFNSIDFSFDKNIKLINRDSISLTYNGEIISFSSVATDNILSLTLYNDITEDGIVCITIPEGSITDENGEFSNSELSYTYTIKRQSSQDFFSFDASPASGNVDSLRTRIYLSFNGEIKLREEIEPLILQKDGIDVAAVNITKSTDNVNVAILSIDTDKNVYTEDGVYTISIPEGYIHNNFYNSISSKDKWNQATTLAYTIGSVIPDPTPDPDPDPNPDPTPIISDEVKVLLNEANLALAKNGVGYPTNESSSYTSLKELVDTVNANTTVAVLSAALDSLYKETNITKPVVGNYYSLSAVNSNGEQLYVTYKDGAIALSSSAGDATKFVAVPTTEGKTTFKTIDDGKYLHVLSASSNIYPSTTSDNVTSVYSSDVNDLTFEKLNIETVDAQKTFGLVSMFGGLGETATGKEGAAYALIDFSKSSIATIPDDNTLMFSDTYSSAFKITDVDKEDITITLSPTVSVSSDYTTLTVSFANSGVTSVSVKASSDEKPYIVSGTTTKDVTLVDAGNNTFTVSLGNLNNGTYTLVIPKGLLTCSKDGIEYVTESVTEYFSINNKDQVFDTSLYFGHNLRFSIDNYYDDTFINDFTVTSNVEITPNPNKRVKIVNYFTGNPVRIGVFTETDDPYSLVLKFVDGTDNDGNALSTEPFTSGELKPNKYIFKIEEASFGDENFAKWLNDNSSATPSSCRVNDSFNVTIKIDSSKATDIISFNEMDNADQKNVIYDLSGRRLQSMEKPGLYIVNGKKVVKR